jgi:dihydroorotase
MSSWAKVICFTLSLAFAMALSSKVSAQAQAAHYGLLLKGGHVIDPANDLDKLADVAIAGGKIAAVAESIPANAAEKVVDLSGLYVTPGLIDIHFHVLLGLGGRDYVQVMAM